MRRPASVPLARRTLFADRRRAWLAVGGVAVALALVLLFDAIISGAMNQVTHYLRTSPADVIVSQEGVRTLHMSSSTLPPDTAERAAAVDGIAWAESLAFMTGTISAGGDEQLSYVFGYDVDTGRGGPAELAEGRPPGAGETVVDSGAAEDMGVAVGDTVVVAGREFTVVGLSTGGTNVANTTAFLNRSGFAELDRPVDSYVLVGASRGTSPDELAERLSRALPETTVQTRDAFVEEERGIVLDMTADLMRIMAAIAFALSLALIALVLSSVTRANLRSYAVVGALGAAPRRLVLTLTAQAAWIAVSATVVATAITVGLAAVVPAVATTLPLDVRPSAIGWVFASALAAAAVGAVQPLRSISRVDPATAFRRAT
ncbi:ABC transporter permease [Nocardiopsis sp. YSL2]|uniref:ABC transporter permease n=1 Tax=Nocardiopsis sp. YSL2 TaxID=2939492 RepID=UPI0026F4320E|nr:ABC transporter permease [Nocardiopsis sp. YSL2]